MPTLMNETKEAGLNQREYPETDPSATYEIKNLTFGPISLTITNEGRTRMQTLPLGRRETVHIDGSRFTDTIWELQARKFIAVKRL